LRLVTFLPLLPLLSVPLLRLRIARPTLFDAPREYFRAICGSPPESANCRQHASKLYHRMRATAWPHSFVQLDVFRSEQSPP
jgi:hypothetical protein